MKFIPSKEMKIDLFKEQEELLCSKENIKKIALIDKVLTFDIYHDDTLIGFAQMHEFEPKCFFLWNFAIDYHFQNQGLGLKALNELLTFMKETLNIKEMTTTYEYGNDIAKHVYEKAGFIETDVVNENDVHEVNMIYKY